jgi:hypothetical protein
MRLPLPPASTHPVILGEGYFTAQILNDDRKTHAAPAAHPGGGSVVRLPLKPADYYEGETAEPYADVMAELELAITERKFRTTGHDKIGSVIRQRDQIDFADYDTLRFCKWPLRRPFPPERPDPLH